MQKIIYIVGLSLFLCEPVAARDISAISDEDLDRAIAICKAHPDQTPITGYELPCKDAYFERHSREFSKEIKELKAKQAADKDLQELKRLLGEQTKDNAELEKLKGTPK